MVDIARANGIPVLGLGTFPLKGDDCQNAVRMALDLGYRHIDTAQMYGNEKDVGDALRSSGMKRDDLFVVTKVDPGNVGADRFASSVAQSMDDLGSPADLLLIHWPPDDHDFDAALDRLMRAKDKGMAKAIGVSNFTAAMVDEAVRLSAAPLVTNQVEYHPYLSQTKVMTALRRHGMALTAYCPIARGKVLGDPVIGAVAEAHGRSATQVTLRWLVQQEGVVAIPRSSNEARITENLGVFDFALSDAEMSRISALGSPTGRLVNGAFAPAWDA